MRLYLDTNVLVDILDREDSASYNLFLRSLRCQYTLVISSWAILELVKIGFAQESDTLLKLLARNEKVVFIRQEPSDNVIARHVRTHFADAVHYVIARRSADAIVTRDRTGFPFRDILVGTPEEF